MPDGMVKPTLRWLNVGLRGIMEAGIVVAFAIWGYHAASGVMAIVLAIAVPVLGFGFWGAVDFHQAGTMGEPLRLTQELVISGLAALALYAAGQPTMGMGFGDHLHRASRGGLRAGRKTAEEGNEVSAAA